MEEALVALRVYSSNRLIENMIEEFFAECRDFSGRPVPPDYNAYSRHREPKRLPWLYIVSDSSKE
ncbi:hypothetical protein J4207_06280 [Candidatus Woesearchaeota archaeon]|nr:hypothetical protein [Candidatus Woesearchaeota archaeon]HLC80403.1 hypothetical protein [Candidatus Nanoarchaeia archaeon]